MSETLQVRQARLADVDELASLEAALQPEPWTRGILSDELTAGGRVYLVAVDGTDVVGYGGVMVVGDEAHVTNLLVVPTHRRRGLGRTIITELFDRANALGARHVTLEVRAGNRPARRLYESVGMKSAGTRPGYYRDDDATIMWARDIQAHLPTDSVAEVSR